MRKKRETKVAPIKPILDCEQFYTLSQARVVYAGWIGDYNSYRPHGSLATSRSTRPWR